MKRFLHLIKSPPYLAVIFLLSSLLIIVNDAWAAKPTAATTSVDVIEDTTVTVYLEGTDTDGNPLTCVQYSSAVNCTVTFGGDDNCTATVTPEENYTGNSAYFQYKVFDGTDYSNTSSVVRLNITAVNDVPVASDIAATIEEDNQASLRASASDVEGSSLTYAIVTGPSHGSASVSSTLFSYTPDEDFNGTDTFTYTAFDGTDTSAPATATITVEAINDRPVSADGAFSADEDKPTDYPLPASDVDNDFSELVCTIHKNPSHGDITVSGCSVTYTSEVGFNGTDSFEYTVTDGDLTSGRIGVVTITVNDINHAPVAQDNYVILRGTDSIDITLTATDADGDALTFAIVSVSGGSATLTGSSVTFTPTADATEATVIFKANDGRVDSNQATVDITIIYATSNENQPPVAEYTELYGRVNTPVTLTMNASDPDGDPLVFTFVSNGAEWGDITYSSSTTYTYWPKTDETGGDCYWYTASDGALSDSELLCITITDGDTEPIAYDSIEYTDEEEPITFIPDVVDRDENPLSYTPITQPANGTLIELGGGQFIYTPNDNFFGVDQAVFTATDGMYTSEEATVYLVVRNVNDPPEVTDIQKEGGENTPIIIRLLGTDKDEDELHYMIASEVKNCAVAINSAPWSSNQTLMVTPNRGFDGQIELTYKAFDNQSASNEAKITITIPRSKNDPPTVKDQEVTVSEDGSIRFDPQGRDPEGEPLSYEIETDAAYGTADIDGDGRIAYSPEADFYGSDSFTFYATDGVNNSSPATVTVNVDPIPDQRYECSTIDASHLQHDATSDLDYWDNLVQVFMPAVATDAQKTELEAIAGGSIVCLLEQPQLNEAESYGVIDIADTAWATYTFDVGTQNFSSLEAKAADLDALSYVEVASVVFSVMPEEAIPPTDNEAHWFDEGMAIDPNFYFDIGLEAAYEYLLAYQEQFGGLKQVYASIIDTGVCAPEIGDGKTDVYNAECDPAVQWIFQSEFNGIIRDGHTLKGLKPTNLDPSHHHGQTTLPYGLIGKDSHGTQVAALMASLSNGDSASPTIIHPTAPNGLFGIYNGVMGGALGFDLVLTSYNGNVGDYPIGFADFYYTGSHPPYDTLTYQNAACGDNLVNYALGPGYMSPNTMTPAELAWHENRFKMRTQVLKNCPKTAHVYAAHNQSTDFSTVNTIYTDSLLPLENQITVQATNFGSTTKSDVTNYGYVAGVDMAAPGRATSRATPLVSGVAGLISSIEPSLIGEEIKYILQASGMPTPDTDTPFLNAGSAVLLTILDKLEGSGGGQFTPLTTTYIEYALDTIFNEPVYEEIAFKDTHHQEVGVWNISPQKHQLTIEQFSHEFNDSTTNESGEILYEKDTSLKATHHYKIGLYQEADSSFPDYQVPFLSFMPAKDNSVQLSGKFDYDYSNSENTGRQTQSYCYQLSYDVNAGKDFSDKGFKFYLAPRSRDDRQKMILKLPHPISYATLVGNVIDYTVQSPIAKDLIRFYTEETPSCSEDIIPLELDNTAEFDAWWAEAESVGCRVEAVTGDNTIYQHVEAEISDANDCTIPYVTWHDVDSDSNENSDNLYLDLLDDTFVTPENYISSIFRGEAYDCAMSAVVTVTEAYSKDYYATGKSGCSELGSFTHNSNQTDTFEVSFDWDLERDFPLLKLLDEIDKNKSEDPYGMDIMHRSDPALMQTALLTPDFISGIDYSSGIGRINVSYPAGLIPGGLFIPGRHGQAHNDPTFYPYDDYDLPSTQITKIIKSSRNVGQ